MAFEDNRRNDRWDQQEKREIPSYPSSGAGGPAQSVRPAPGNSEPSGEAADTMETRQNGASFIPPAAQYSQGEDAPVSPPEYRQPPAGGEYRKTYQDIRQDREMAYPSYQQWQSQEEQRAQTRTQQEQHRFDRIYEEAPKKKKRNRKGLKIVAGVVAAVLLLGGGVMIGTALSGGFYNDVVAPANGDANPPADAQDNTAYPTLNISEEESTGGLAPKEVYAKVAPSIVSIQATSLVDGSASTGSGIIMTEDGYIITNNHVISGKDKFTVVLNDGTEYEASVIGSDEKTDIAVIKITPDTALTPAEFGNSDQLAVGDRAFAIGSPSGVGLQNTFTGGYISAINREITVDDRVMTLIQTDASINPGNSGGALINDKAQIVGITTAKLGISYYEGLGFAIPINSAKEIVDELIANGRIIGRPALGISGYNISKETAEANNVPQGVLVAAVDTRSGAYTAGIQKGDIITGVNGTAISTMSQINAIKEDFKAGDEITVSVYRAGKSIELQVTLVAEEDLSTDAGTQNAQTNQNDQNNSYFTNPYSYFFGY